ncbi:B12-binding domain-containing protein [Streptomyces sp. NPDC059740]|uniref:cobalamin B12-binding domain-containing protein n=1 Tax=Streptomyces sp. NPDC059740 TaxID=3346926 RepID=UPI003647BEE5
MTSGAPHVTPADRSAFGDCLARADERAALALVDRLLTAGVAAQDVLLDLVAPGQTQIGTRWAENEWTVAQEHAATSVSEACVVAISGAPHPPADSGQVVVACSDGEWHTLPARLLTEVLRLNGFDARFLGGHVPAARLVSDLHQNGPDLVAISCTLSVRLPLAHALVTAVRRSGCPVLAGGAGFGPDGVWARSIGADLYARDAAAAAELLRRRWPPRLAAHDSSTAPEAAEAYHWFTRNRSRLLTDLGGGAGGRFPGTRLPGGEGEATAQNIGYLVDALAAAVYVDDDTILTDYLVFLHRLLVAKEEDTRRLHSVLTRLADLVREVPRLHEAAERARRRYQAEREAEGGAPGGGGA